MVQIKENSFGIRCWQTLVNLQGHDDELKEMIFSIMKETIIKEMKKEDIKYYDVRLLNGIYELVNET